MQYGYEKGEVSGDPFVDAGCALLVVGHDGRVARANRAARRFAVADIRPEGALLDELFRVPEGSERVSALLSELSSTGDAAERELLVIGAHGEPLVLLWTAAQSGAGAVLSATDVTVHHATTAELTHRLLHDPLTGLPNRVLLVERLSQATRRLERQGGELAVLFLDVDRFKEVNDTRGHAAGDRLLVALADRLRAVLRPSDTVARFAGDEFVVVCEDVDGNPAVTDIAGRVVAAIERPFRLNGHGVALTVSIGMALARHSGADPEALLHDADAAMYRAKESSKGRTSSVVIAGDDATLDPDEFRRGMAEGELVVAYQPQVSLNDGRLIGMEALARWHHPRLGTVLPAAFLRAAEGSGLVVELGRRVLADACRRSVEWQAAAAAAGRPAPFVSVNLSLRELSDPSLSAGIARAIEFAGADPALIRVEISERSLVRDPARVASVLQDLKRIGVCSVLDDVGRALPSLEPLHDLPLEELKLDRTWLRSSVPGGDRSDTMGEVARVARNLGIRAVAEGIETDDELEAVRSLGYDAAAGRWFAAPQPAELVSRLVTLDMRWPTEGVGLLS